MPANFRVFRMKFLFDVFPLLLFFAAFKLYDIYVATAVAIVASIAQVGLFWWRHRRFETMHLITLAVIVVFGGLTLLLHNDTFIKWKPTILYWFFAATLLFSALLLKKNLMRALLQDKMALPDFVWHRLNLSWSAFFASLGILNLYVAFNFSTDAWVNFKLFGATGIMLLFVLAQAALLSKYVEEDGKEP